MSSNNLTISRPSSSASTKSLSPRTQKVTTFKIKDESTSPTERVETPVKESKNITSSSLWKEQMAQKKSTTRRFSVFIVDRALKRLKNDYFSTISKLNSRDYKIKRYLRRNAWRIWGAYFRYRLRCHCLRILNFGKELRIKRLNKEEIEYLSFRYRIGQKSSEEYYDFSIVNQRIKENIFYNEKNIVRSLELKMNQLDKQILENNTINYENNNNNNKNRQELLNNIINTIRNEKKDQIINKKILDMITNNDYSLFESSSSSTGSSNLASTILSNVPSILSTPSKSPSKGSIPSSTLPTSSPPPSPIKSTTSLSPTSSPVSPTKTLPSKNDKNNNKEPKEKPIITKELIKKAKEILKKEENLPNLTSIELNKIKRIVENIEPNLNQFKKSINNKIKNSIDSMTSVQINDIQTLENSYSPRKNFSFTSSLSSDPTSFSNTSSSSLPISDNSFRILSPSKPSTMSSSFHSPRRGTNQYSTPITSPNILESYSRPSTSSNAFSSTSKFATPKANSSPAKSSESSLIDWHTFVTLSDLPSISELKKLNQSQPSNVEKALQTFLDKDEVSLITPRVSSSHATLVKSSASTVTCTPSIELRNNDPNFYSLY